MAYYLAIDIGASSGRHILGSLENGKLNLQEVYRFDNGFKNENGKLVWDVESLFYEVREGIKKCKEISHIPPTHTHGQPLPLSPPPARAVQLMSPDS